MFKIKMIFLKEDEVKLKVRTKKKLHVSRAVYFANWWFISAVMVQ